MIGVGTREASARATALPSAGPASALVAELLSTSAARSDEASHLSDRIAAMLAAVDDPLADDDLQLALYLCFELHYRSFPNVDPAWEWSPSLLAVRALLEQAFFDALEAALGPGERVDPQGVGDLLFSLEAGDVAPRSRAGSSSRPTSTGFASSSFTARSTS